MYDFCVIGACPTGLTLAYRLAQSGRSVLIVERDVRPGGLAKSFNIEGNIFDIGPKRFHTDDPKVIDFLNEVAAEHLLKIGRSTKVYFLERYLDWPLSTRDLPRLPVGV